MKPLLLLTSLLLTASADADIIKCTFTEPFINLEYSMTQSSLTVSGLDITTTRMKSVSFQIFGPGSFELWDKHKNSVLQLQMDYNGSDGMSDFVYPYSAIYNGQHGGCTSNFAHKTTSSLR